MDIGCIHATPVAQLRADPVPAVRGGPADVRQDHSIAGGDEEDDFDVRGGRPGTERTAVHVHDGRDGAVRSVGRRGDPGLDRSGRTGRLGQGHHRHREPPLPGRPDPRPDAWRPTRRGRGSASSMARTPSVPSQLIAPVAGPRVATAREWATMSPVDEGLDPDRSSDLRRQVEGRRVSPPSRRDRGDDPVRGRPERSAAARRHPARQVRVGPLADGSVQVRREHPRLRRPIDGGGDEARAEVVEGLGLVQADRRRSRRPSGDHAGWLAQPPAARTSRGSVASVPSRSTSTAQIVVRGRRSASGPRARGEGDRPAIGAPCDVGHAPIARGDLARGGTRRRVDHEEVRPAIEVADAVPAPIRAGDAPGQRGTVAT